MEVYNGIFGNHSNSERLQNGFKPTFEYEMYPMGGCQLFGCIQHGNPEYEGA